MLKDNPSYSTGFGQLIYNRATKCQDILMSPEDAKQCCEATKIDCTGQGRTKAQF